MWPTLPITYGGGIWPSIERLSLSLSTFLTPPVNANDAWSQGCMMKRKTGYARQSDTGTDTGTGVPQVK